ncbi:MAG: acyl-CoA dehydrogenase family protein [Rhodospirillaceae bacterium]|jgi:3-hydroxy-9,10-secoandrosta-1,3,5(10)-triene-9,17-dione monooxygenase
MTDIPVLSVSSERGDQLLTDLQAMVPALRERGRAADDAGRLPDATIEDLHKADAFRAVVAESYGGMELPFPYIPQIFRILGRGCTSTAWCMGFLIYHNFQIAHFPKEAQDETWGTRGFTMAPGQVMPSGRATVVDGGYKLNGRWGYATGILHGDFMLLSAPVQDGDKTLPVQRFCVPVEEFEVLDTWHVAAMRATGSRDVTLDDVFVPAHRTITVESLRERQSSGLEINNGKLWQVPLLIFMGTGAVGSLIGAAEAMMEIVGEILKTKVGAYSGDKQQGLMTQRVRMGRLAMELEAAIGLWQSEIDKIWQLVLEDKTPSREERVKVRMIVSHVASKCHAIVDELAVVAGSRGTFLDSPVQRFHRDAGSLATHALFEYDHTANMYGGTLLDIDVPEGAMI